MNEQLKTGERISELLTIRGTDNKTFAKAMGVNVSTVGRWRNNAKYMRLTQAVKIAEYFGCSLEFLVGRTEEILDFSPCSCPPFYPHLRELMKEKGISRNRVNKETHIKSSHFVDWKSGADPHILSLLELAEYFDVSLDKLVGREK